MQGDKVTAAGAAVETHELAAQSSTLPFDPRDLMRMRVPPAAFARMVGVSKQAVSKAIKAGKLTLGADGKIDPEKGVREYLANTHPARIQARLLKSVGGVDVERLQARVQQLESALAESKAARQREAAAFEAAARAREQDEAARQLEVLCEAIAANFDQAIAARDRRELEDWLDRTIATAVYGQSPDEYDALFAPDQE